MNDTSQRACVLLVEDEALLAMMLEDLLHDRDVDVVKAARIPAALELVATRHIDAAILDIRIATEEVFPVADALQQAGIPILFSSGYGDNGLPADYREYPMLQKPYGLKQIQDALDALMARAGGAAAVAESGKA